MLDWSLDPRFRAVLGRLPLPINLPTPLVRATGAITSREILGSRAVITRWQDDLDVAIGRRLQAAGATVTITDPAPALPLAPAMRHEPWHGELPDGLMASVHGTGPGPVLLVHRPEPPGDAEPDRNPQTDRLLAVGHVGAHLPRRSRLLVVLADDLVAGAGPLLQALAAGMMRSAQKELGRQGTTVHVVRQGGAEAETLADVVAFLGGPRAAFLTGLDLTLRHAVGPLPGEPSASPSLLGKVAVVTGGARGIGAAIARRLAQEGADVWINDLAAAATPADLVIAAIHKAGGKAHFIGADIATAAGAGAIAGALRDGPGRVDIVVHNAGITRDKTLRKMSLAQWRLVLQVDFGAMVRVQAALDPMLQAGGAVVLMSSVMAIAGNFGQANYTAAKAAVLELCRQWAVAGARRGVRANAIAPGFILTEMTAHLPLLNREMAKQLTALLQPGQPEDVADLTAFLVSPAARGVSGQTVRCDGGMAFGA